MLLLQFAVHAQQRTVTGIVMQESEKGRLIPIQGATVQWLGTSIGTYTDSLGVFELPEEQSTRRAVITYIGFNSDTILIPGPEKVTVVLKSANNLKEVKIEYRRKSTTISSIDPLKVQQIGQKELFKAACCNLSESFETNPSVDVAFTDAVSGAKQIQLLGLAGPYTQITQENIPTIRGLSSVNGLGQLPGTWIEGMQLAKGTGSVANGYESIAGQLNVELHKPAGEERLIVNGYAGQGGRLETNVVANQKLSENWGTGMLVHASTRFRETDMNKDGFMDNPTGSNYNLMNRWEYHNDKGFESQFGFGILSEDKKGGQLSRYSEPSRYGFSSMARKYEAFVKTGYVFPELRYKSIGLQVAVQRYEQHASFGSLNRYSGEQSTLYANLIYQSIIGTSDHKFRTGLSYSGDLYNETFNQAEFKRNERVPGAFFEYTWTASPKFSMVAGLRGDVNTIYGNFLTPRLHARYEIAKKKVIRFSGGSGRKTSNVLAENSGLMATSRSWMFAGNSPALPYGLQQEKAWNLGLNYTHHFELDYREGIFSVDFYRTDFVNQVVVDLDRSAREVVLHNLHGKSYANSLQIEVDYELLKHLDLRMAYRYYDIQTQYLSYQAIRPLVSTNRAFINLGYETASRWTFDGTLNWVGSKRLPFTGDNPVQYQLAGSSPSYFLVNAQVTKDFKGGFSTYVGVENLNNFKQKNAIIASEDPNGKYFDSSVIWGPVFGRMVYVGFRYTLKS